MCERLIAQLEAKDRCILDEQAGIIAGLRAENQRLRDENQQLRAENQALIARLKLEIAKRFGASSERQEPAPAEKSTSAVMEGETATGLETSTVSAEVVPASRKRGGQEGHKGHGRHIPAVLPREEREHDLPVSERQCSQCGLPYQDTGLTDDSEEVDVQVKIVVLRHKRKCYRPTCKCEGLPALIVAPPAPKLIPKGKFTVQTWVKFLLDKYLAQIPVNRQRLLLSQAGLPVAKGTIHGGFDRLYDYLCPLYEHFLARLRLAEHAHADETRWMIFEAIEGKANCRWWFWLFASDDVVCCVLDPSRSAAVPFKTLSQVMLPTAPADPTATTRQIEGQTYVFTPHLKVLSADRYPAYPALSPTLQIAFCWAHQRRDFTDFLKAYADQPEWVAWANAWITTIANLYALNAQRLDVLTDPQAFDIAQTQLEQAIALVAQQVAERSNLPIPQRKILDSMHNHWSGLTIFVHNPAIPMDNNYAERLIRTPVVGRKNYLGHQSRRAGHTGAMMFSLVLTCQLHEISPFDFLVSYFQACAQHGRPPSDLTPFSPWLKSTSTEVNPPSHSP